MVPPRGAVYGTPLGGRCFLFFLCLKMSWLCTIWFRMTEYGWKFHVGHIFGPPTFILVFVKGHIKMLDKVMNITFFRFLCGALERCRLRHPPRGAFFGIFLVLENGLVLHYEVKDD